MLYTIILIIYFIILLFYVYVRHCYSYWFSQNVPYIPPKFPYGNFKGMFIVEHAGFMMQRFYNEMKGKGSIIGLYSMLKPAALITDMDMIKQILVKDFNYFTSRGVYYNEKDDPLSAHLFNIDGIGWKKLRSKLTPTFTSGKMKFMFPTIISVSHDLKKSLKQEIKKDSNIQMKDILGRFTTDVIGNCAFGIECNSLYDKTSDFHKFGKKPFQEPKLSRMADLFLNMFPNVGRKLHIKRLSDDVTTFFTNIVKETVRYREENNVQRKDFINLLMQLKDNGKLDDDDDQNEVINSFLTIDEITAQAFVFFIAGFETTSTTMAYCLHELASNLDIQEKARKEVNDVLHKFNGEMSYEAIGEMKYVEQIINETLRLYPPITILTRVVEKTYQIPNSEIILETGIKIFIPVYAIHHDPELYPNPEKFNPDRFSDEEQRNRSPYAFLPFGVGPRNCIGLRFGMLEAKVGIATLLANFKFTFCSKTDKKLKFAQNLFVLNSLGGCWLNVEEI